MRKILAISLMTILIASCHQRSEDSYLQLESSEDSYVLADMVTSDMVSLKPKYPDEINDTVEKIEKQGVIVKKVIKDGRLIITVSELEKSKLRIDTLTKNHGGYYANESFSNMDSEASFNLKIRIPFANFDKFISAIESGDGEIQYKAIDARDVTDQFIDLQTRLENKRNYLKRYNELLIKAKNVKEILEIEEKIRVLEEEIESTTGKLKYLSDLVDYSTLELTISKPKDFVYNPASRDKFSERLKQSLSKGWFGFIDFLLFAIKLWPFWIIVGVIIYLMRKFVERRNKKRLERTRNL